jgi:hypothetical protein
MQKPVGLAEAGPVSDLDLTSDHSCAKSKAPLFFKNGAFIEPRHCSIMCATTFPLPLYNVSAGLF